MKFCELLEQYMRTLSCTGTELSELSGISPSVISRYKTGEREPQIGSDTLNALAKALSDLAANRQMKDMTEEKIISSFENALISKSVNYTNLIQNFNILYSELNLNMKRISSYTNYDTSFLYRIKSGERKVANPEDFCDKIAQYLIADFSSYESLELVSGLIKKSVQDLSTPPDYYQAIYKWLLSNTNTVSINTEEKGNDISQFLKKMDEFDLEDYIQVIHFNELKVPTVPFHLPSTKIYNGIVKMREGELDFFKTTVTSKNAKSILLCANMPMLDLAEDNDFNKKWMFAIACALKKGLHMDMVHYLERPFEELLLGLEAWIPIYMTGQVSPYYIPNHAAHVFHHLDYISEAAVLHGECIDGGHDEGRYILTNTSEELAYYHKRAKRILTHAKPLMHIYTKEKAEEFYTFLLEDSNTAGTRHNILSSLPIYTISEPLLNDILASNNINETDADTIRTYRKHEIERMNAKLEHSTITDELSIPLSHSYEEHPMNLSVSGCFYDLPILYSYQQMQSHLKETLDYANKTNNYNLNINKISAFRNIQIEIMDDQYVIISKLKSPSIHFVIMYPVLVQALQNFTIPVMES